MLGSAVVPTAPNPHGRQTAQAETTQAMNHTYGTSADIDSRYAWSRLLSAALIGTIGNVGMW